jgi:tetratricopeptide (TPR) repeat protein
MRMAAVNYRMAYKASVHPAVAMPDLAALYSAGDAAYATDDFAAAIEDLDTLIGQEYYDEGNAFLVKAASQYRLGLADEAFATMSKGMELFPSNEGLINLAMFFYTDQEKDPSELVPSVLAAIEKNPDNARLYDGLARIYNALDDQEKAIETIDKAIELTPEDWIPYYLKSNYISAKVSKMNDEAASKSMSLSHSENQAAKAAIDDVLKGAVTALEKAHELAPTRTEVVARLKELTFLLREYPEYAVLNEKYSKLFEEM